MVWDNSVELHQLVNVICKSSVELLHMTVDLVLFFGLTTNFSLSFLQLFAWNWKPLRME